MIFLLFFVVRKNGSFVRSDVRDNHFIRVSVNYIE
jgi:hypothetical protein